MERKPQSYVPHFAVAWAIVIVLGLAAVTGSVLSIVNYTSKASKSSVAKVEKAVNPGQDAIVQSACTAVVADAASGGVIISSCKLAPVSHALQVKGTHALVVVEAESKQQGAKYSVVVSLVKGVWSPEKVQVAGAIALPKSS